MMIVWNSRKLNNCSYCRTKKYYSMKLDVSSQCSGQQHRTRHKPTQCRYQLPDEDKWWQSKNTSASSDWYPPVVNPYLLQTPGSSLTEHLQHPDPAQCSANWHKAHTPQGESNSTPLHDQPNNSVIWYMNAEELPEGQDLSDLWIPQHNCSYSLQL